MQTNLICLHDLLRPQFKGEMMVLETKNDRTLFFDLLPVGFSAPSGLLIKFKIYTVPGQVVHNSTRKAVLSRADGVVFIADSNLSQGLNNAEAFQNLEANTEQVGLDFARLPLAIQFNKRDLPNVISEKEVLERWGKTPWSVFFATALNGKGVMETLSHVLAKAYDSLEKPYELSIKHGLTNAKFVSGIMGNFQAL